MALPSSLEPCDRHRWAVGTPFTNPKSFPWMGKKNMWRSSKGREQVWHSAHFQCRKVPKPGLSVWKRQSTGILEESSPYHSDPSCRRDGCAINLLWHWWSLSSLLLQLKALATIAAMTAIASSVVGALKSVTWNAEFLLSCPTWNMPFPP